jgi:DNA-binding GntR family transcriptional regulator
MNGELTRLSADRIAAELRRSITQGAYFPRTPLRDAAIAEEFGVSRNTVREALRLLRNDGLVVHQLNKGVIVRSITAEDVRDIYVVRRTLELRAIDDSSVASNELLAALPEAVAESEAAAERGVWRDVGTASLELHRRVVALLASPSLDQFFSTVLARLRLAFTTMKSEEEFQAPWIERDREISELLTTGQRAEAHALMRLYLHDSERQVLDVVRHQNHEPSSRPRAVRKHLSGIREEGVTNS